MESLYTVTSLPERYLQCGMCLGNIQKPMSFPCLHSFCRDCLFEFLKKERKQNRNFECPTCCTKVDLSMMETSGNNNEALFLKQFPANNFLEMIVKTVVSLTNEDKNCDICSRIGKYEDAAMNWCCDCSEAMCESCSGVHQATAVTSSHQVCSLADARQKPLSLLLKRRRDVQCKHHDGEIVKLYCKRCCVTLCAQCVTEEHKRCGTCLTISDAFRQHSDELDNLSGKWDDLQRFVAGAKGEVTEEREVFNEHINSTKEEITTLSDSLCKRIRDSEQKLLKQLEKLRLEAEPEMSSRITVLEDCDNRLQKTRDVIEQILQYGCDSEIMASFAAIHDQTLQSETITYDVVASNRTQREFSFRVAKPVEAFSRAFDDLGQLDIHSSVSKNGLQQIGNWGIACVSRDDLVVVDGTNKAIYKFRRGGNLVDQISVSDEPRDVTHLGVGDIAVTMSRNQILFLSTTSKIRLREAVKTQKSYHGISVCGPERFVVTHMGSHKCIDIITMQGVIERTIPESDSGDTLFFEPRYVTCTKGDNRMILVSDFRQNQIVCLSPDGSVTFRYETANGRRAFRPLGICTDRLGNIFVADYTKDEVVLLTGDGQFQRSVVTGESELENPVAIDISRDGRLVVLQNDGMVKVFSY